LRQRRQCEGRLQQVSFLKIIMKLAVRLLAVGAEWRTGRVRPTTSEEGTMDHSCTTRSRPPLFAIVQRWSPICRNRPSAFATVRVGRPCKQGVTTSAIYGTSTSNSMRTSSGPCVEITPTPPDPSFCSQSCIQTDRFERLSMDMSGDVTPSDQARWISMDVVGRSGSLPKVPGSRPGRPT
jgi:hypothetical protein